MRRRPNDDGAHCSMPRCLALTALLATVAALVSACTRRDPDLLPTPISPALRAALAERVIMRNHGLMVSLSTDR